MFRWLRAQLGNLAGRRVRGLSLVAGYLANVLWLIESSWRSLIAEGYGKNSVAYAALRLLSQSIPEARMRVYSGEGDDRQPLGDEHPLVQLILRPNPLMSEFEWWELTTLQLAGVGRSLWWKERANSGQVLALWPLRPDRVGPVYSAAPGIPITGWAYVDPDAVPHFIPLADIVVFTFPDPDGESGGIVEGFGPLSAARADISSDNMATQHTGALLANYAQPGIALKVQDAVDEDTANLIKAKFRQEFGGNRIGTPAILDAGAEIEVLGFSLQQLEFTGLRADTESRICAALGVPSILVGVNSGLANSTYSNFESARQFFAETTLSFYWRRYADTLTHDLAGDFGEGLTCEFDTSTVRALAQQFVNQLAPWKESFAGGVITLNEYRAKLKLKALPAAVGDMLYVPSNVVLTGATEALIAEAEAQEEEEEAKQAEQAEQQFAQQKELLLSKQTMGQNGNGGKSVKYNPNQPREPGGQPTGGRWTDGSGSGGGGAERARAETDDPSFYSSDTEHAYIYSDDGQLIAEQGGTATGIDHFGIQKKDARNAHYVHNHPGSDLEDDTWTFSDVDLETAIDADMASITATGIHKTYTMTRPAGGWMDHEAAMTKTREMLKFTPEYVRDFIRYRDGHSFGDSAKTLNRDARKFWRTYARITGATYTETRRKTAKKSIEDETTSELAQLKAHLPERITLACPLCASKAVDRYDDHGGLCVCAECNCTFDPALELA